MGEQTPTTGDQHILITRVFDAPRAQVFRAWTEPEAVAAWYGPEHIEVPRDRVEIDLRVGGRYQLTMLMGAAASSPSATRSSSSSSPNCSCCARTRCPRWECPNPACCGSSSTTTGPGRA